MAWCLWWAEFICPNSCNLKTGQRSEIQIFCPQVNLSDSSFLSHNLLRWARTFKLRQVREMRRLEYKNQKKTVVVMNFTIESPVFQSQYFFAYSVLVTNSEWVCVCFWIRRENSGYFVFAFSPHTKTWCHRHTLTWVHNNTWHSWLKTIKAKVAILNSD